MASVDTLSGVARQVDAVRVARSARHVVRDALVYLGVVLLVPLWLPARIERAFRLGESWYVLGSEFLSLFPGKPGIFLRRAFYLMILDHCATDVNIGFGTTISHPQASLHRGVSIGNRCSVGQVVLEPHATIGSNVDILSGRRQHHFDRLDHPIQDQGGRFTQIRIGANCWIGNSSVIMADIGADCVIGAGAVVVKPIPPRSVAVGNPAVVKRARS